MPVRNELTRACSCCSGFRRPNGKRNTDWRTRPGMQSFETRDGYTCAPTPGARARTMLDSLLQCTYNCLGYRRVVLVGEGGSVAVAQEVEY
eukprot:2267226-Pyramimonas_sp.AAC.1